MSYLQLGTVRLELITHVESFEGALGYAYASHDIIEGKSHLQWTGDQLETRSLSCMLHMRWCDPLEEYQKLKQAAEGHQALRLFFANGTYEGHYVVEELQKTLTQTDAQGNIYLMQLRVQLKEYVEARRKATGTGGGGWFDDSGFWNRAKPWEMPGIEGGILSTENIQTIGRVTGEVIAAVQNPMAFAREVAGNFAGSMAGLAVAEFGPVGASFAGAYNAMARQKVQEVLR